VIAKTLQMPALTRATIDPKTIPGLEATAFSTVIESNEPILIWTLSFGAAFGKLIPYWLGSIRGMGRWPHDVVLLGDRHVMPFESSDARAIDIVPSLERLYGAPVSDWYANLVHNAKPQILFHVDLDRYDYVLYMDVDCLVNSDRLEGLVAAAHARGKITVQRDRLRVRSGLICTGRDTLSADEKKQWGHHAICAGIVGAPTNDMGRRFLNAWYDVNADSQFRKNDQANLIALLLRQYADDWDYVGETRIVQFTALTRYAETIIHFSGADRQKDLLRRYYAEYLQSI
jgi:hypothetical protein